MTLARVQPFCRRHGPDIGAYKLNKNRELLETVKEKIICLYIYKNHFWVLWKLSRKTSLLESIDDIENIFKYEETQIDNNISKQRIEYNFPISYEMNCLYSCKDQLVGQNFV